MLSRRGEGFAGLEGLWLSHWWKWYHLTNALESSTWPRCGEDAVAGRGRGGKGKSRETGYKEGAEPGQEGMRGRMKEDSQKGTQVGEEGALTAASSLGPPDSVKAQPASSF